MNGFSPISSEKSPSPPAKIDPSGSDSDPNASDSLPTLCSPDLLKSCFACCPPIRPAGYEHVQHRTIVQRVLRENTLSFSPGGAGILPIRGFSCWALGYLDRRCRLVGCLLHPAVNNGRDFRYRIAYGDKCSREACREASAFLGLDISERGRWLQLTDGLDAFAYSSRAFNPLFRMLGWGVDLLRRVALEEPADTFRREIFFRKFPVFTTRLNPWGNAYLMRAITRARGIDPLRGEGFRTDFEAFAGRLRGKLGRIKNPAPKGPFTHHLGLDPEFSDFLRLSIGLRRTSRVHAEALWERTDGAVASFLKPPFSSY